METSTHRRRWATPSRIALLALGVAVAGSLLYFDKKAPPRAARLLPESDAIVYFNLRPLRAATHFDRHPVPHDPTYQQFIDATGIEMERDLDEAAFALVRSANPFGPNGPVAYAEVVTGHFDPARLNRYLDAHAAARELYAAHTVYSLPSQDRTVRVAILDGSMVAISNTPTPEQMHAILDHAREWSMPFSGPTLLTAHYADVPMLSLAWGIGQLGLPFAEHGELRLLGFTLPFRLESTLIASLRWTGALRLRVEEIAPGDGAAAASASALRAVLKIARFAEGAVPENSGGENAVRTLLDTATVRQQGDRAIVEATLPQQLLAALFTPQTGKSSSSGTP